MLLVESQARKHMRGMAWSVAFGVMALSIALHLALLNFYFPHPLGWPIALLNLVCAAFNFYCAARRWRAVFNPEDQQ